MAKKRQNNNSYSAFSDELDLIFNKITEVSNSGNQQLYDLITDVEGKISNQLMDIRNNIFHSGNASSSSWSSLPSQPTYIPTTVAQPIIQQDNALLNSQLNNILNQISSLKSEISVNKSTIDSIANNNVDSYQIGTIIDTNNKNSEQLYSALNYLENNISNCINEQKDLSYNFFDSLSSLREEIYASQNSLYEAINMSSGGNNAEFLYNELTKVNDENTQNLFNYIQTIEEGLKNNAINTTNFLSSAVHNKISNLENKIDNTNQDLISMDYSILDRVEENSMRQDDSLNTLRNELLYSNDNILENTEYKTAELHNKLDDSFHTLRDELLYSNDNILENTEYKTAELHNKLDDSFHTLRDELLYSNDNILENTEYKTAELHNRLDDLENRMHFTSEDSINMDYTILDKVDESSIIYNDLLVNLREELLYSNNENLNEIMNVATQLREELLDNDYQNTSHILNETYNLNAESQDQLSYINEQISHIKEMLFNLNDIVGVNNNQFKNELDLINKNSNNSYLNEINSLKELIKQKNNNGNDNNNDKYHNEIERLKELIINNSNNQNANVETKKIPNNNNQNYIEDVPWDEWEEVEGDEMENYKNNKRVVRIDESKLDMIYERVEQINYEINAKLYDLENNILNIIHDRDNEIDYKIAESSARSERLILSSIEESHSENETKYANLRKEFLDKVTELKDDFYEKNKESISEWNTNLSKSMEEMNKITSDIIDEMIQSQRRFEDLFMSVESRFASFEEQMGRLSSDQFAIYDENAHNIETIFNSIEKHKKDIKKTHLMWDENNEKIESLKEKILINTKEISKMNLSTEHRDINASLKQIDDLKSTSEEFKVELNTIRENNEKIEKSLETEKEAIDEKINILYTDFHSLIDSFDQKIQYDLDNLTGESIAHIEKTSGEITEKIITLETQLDSNSSILENKIEVVNHEINDILSNLDNLDNKIQQETDEKLQSLYNETLELVSSIQFENENTRAEIEETNKYLSKKLNESNTKIEELQVLIENTVIDPSKDERVDDLIDRVNEMKSFNTEAISKIEDIYNSWYENNKKLEILEDVLGDQANEIQNLRSLTGEAFDDSFDKINVLYENENKIKDQIKQILKSNSLLESKLQEEKTNLESKIEDVSTNIDTMIVDLDNKVTEKTDNKMIKLYEETINMIDELKKENQTSFEEISIVNEGVSLNLFEVNSKIAELEHFTHLEPEHDEKFSRLFETIREIKTSTIQTTNEVRDCIEAWKTNNEKISSLEKILENKSQEILSLVNNSEMNFSDLFNRTEELYKSESSIKNEILSINSINSKLEKKLSEEKQNLDNKIRILNEELENKISSTESDMLSYTDSKIDEINTNIDSKLITLHNEVMNLINELNENNQDLNHQISIIENDTLKTFDYLQIEMEDLKSRGGISRDNPIYLEVTEAIARLSDENKEQSDHIMQLHEELSKNIERSKSLKKILVAQSEEIQFIASSSEGAISTSFDRIHELFNSEKTIKEEIEKIYIENKSFKNEIEDNKEKLSEKLVALTSEIDKKIADQEHVIDSKIVSSEEKIDDKLMQMNYDLIEQISSIHYENISTLEKISDVEIAFANKIESNKDEMLVLENLIKSIPDHNEKFTAISEDIQKLFENSEVSFDQMQENFESIKQNNKKIDSLKVKLDKQGQQILTLGEYTEGNLSGAYDLIHELHISENKIKEEIEKIYTENKGFKDEIEANKEKLNEKLVALTSELDKKITDQESVIDSKIVLSEEKIDDKLMQMNYDLIEQISSIHYENISTLEKISDVEIAFANKIESNKDEMLVLENLIKSIPDHNEKFTAISEDIQKLFENSEVSFDQMQENFESIKQNNKKIDSLKVKLDKQGQDIIELGDYTEGNLADAYDLIHELHTSENKIKEEIEKIYTENKTIKNQIIVESSKNKKALIEKASELKEILAASEIKILQKTDEDKNEIKNIISDLESNVLAETDKKIEDVKNDTAMKIDLIYQEMLSIINELSDGQNELVQEITNLDSFTRLSLMTVDSKISEIDFLVNKLPEEDPRFQKMISEIDDLKIFSEITNKEILKITNVWKNNNKKLASLEELLISQSEELRLLSRSSEEVWNVSLDRIQELFESEKTIKEEIEKIYIENKDIKNKLTEEKDKIHNKIDLINNDILKVINASEEKVLAEIISSEEKVMNDIDTKVAKISSEIEEKITALYSEISEIIHDINLFTENNAEEINKLKEEVNTFVVDVNNNLFEINEEINLLPEENPKFKPLVEKVEQLRLDNDTSMYEIKKIYDSWITNNKKLASLEEILLSQSEELRSLSRSSEEVWNLSFDRIQELFESEKNIKEEIESFYVETNAIHTKLATEKEKVLERIEEIQNDLSKEIYSSKEILSNEIDEKVSKVSTDINEKISSLYSEMTEIINQVHSFAENNSEEINKLKEEVNSFVLEVNNNLFEINEQINLLPEEDPKFKPLVEKVEQLRSDNDTSMYEIKKIYDSWITNNKKLDSLEELLLSQSEELRSLSRSSEEVWNLSFDRIQELFESEKNIKEEIESIYSETNSIKSKLLSEKSKIKDRIKTMESDLNEKMFSIEKEIGDKIDTETKNLSDSLTDDFSEKIDCLLKETLELVDNLRVTSEESVSRFEDMNKFLSEDLNNCNNNIVLLEEKLSSDIQVSGVDLDHKIADLKELNVSANNEIEKNKKLWLLNNFKLTSFIDLLENQSSELTNMNSDYEPSPDLKRKIDELIKVDENLKFEIMEIMKDNSKIEKNLKNQKTILVNKMDDLVSDVKKEIGEDFDSKVDLVYKNSMEFLENATVNISENRESIDIIHNLVNNNYELANERIQKLVEDVNQKFDKQEGLEKINELAHINDSISEEISRIQKDWLLNNEKLKSLDNMLKDELEKQRYDIDSLDYKNNSLQENLLDILEMDGSINNEIESLKNKNLILEDNLFNFKKDFENNIKEIINEIDNKIDAISINLDPRKIIKETDIIKSIEEIVYSIVTKEINNLPFKKELLILSEEDRKIKEEVKNIIHKLNNKNVKINQLIFDEIWNCNLKIESLIDEVMNISAFSNNNIIDLKKYADTSSNEIKKVYNLWVVNNKKISELEQQIERQANLLTNIGENSDITKINENISKLESEISSIESENNFISNKINEITKKQEISTENLYKEILQITNEIDVNLHKRIDETLKNTDFKIDDNLKDKEEIKKLILKYSEEIIAAELRTFVKMFEENNSELNKSHRAWLKNVQRISLLEDIIIEHEKGFKEANQINTLQKDENLNQKEKEAIEKLIANHKKRLL